MELIVYSSAAYREFLEAHLGFKFGWHETAQDPPAESDALCLLHLTSLGDSGRSWLKRYGSSAGVKIAVCADRPDLREMLESAEHGARAYFNSHMARIHFDQVIRLLDQGQSWFPPEMLGETFRLARQAVKAPADDSLLECLTHREREIANAVGEGKSNRQIAHQLEISEPTVKTHLTSIFRKLELNDRVSLALYLK